ncbi:MAG: DoxX family protein [Candidatus Marinimicrobia bacterium]|nr:DoxX family protein [Candidatus Neomarinimicrobiota bacterium]
MTFLNKISENGHWLLRIFLAVTFLYHGFIKFPIAEMMAQSMGMPVFMVYLLASMEVAGGVLILAGAYITELATRLAGGIFTVIMLGAISMVHWPRWSFVASESHPMGGMEFQVLIILVSLLFVAGGNRAFKSDNLSRID